MEIVIGEYILIYGMHYGVKISYYLTTTKPYVSRPLMLEMDK